MTHDIMDDVMVKISDLETENERLKKNLAAISCQSNPRAHVLGLLEENERLREVLGMFPKMLANDAYDIWEIVEEFSNIATKALCESGREAGK